MKEIWKDVVGYEGKYQISNLGNVMNLRTNQAIGKGRYNVTLYGEDGKPTNKTKVAMMAEAFLEKPETNEKLFAIMIDKDKPLTVNNIQWRYTDCEKIFNQSLLNKNLYHIKRMLLDNSEGIEEFHEAIKSLINKYSLFKEKNDRLQEINNLEERLAKLKEEFRNDYDKKG